MGNVWLVKRVFSFKLTKSENNNKARCRPMQTPRYTGIISSQLIEIIEWTDTTNDTIIYKFPAHNNQIKNSAQLTVRESQVAIFLNEGQMGDVFYPKCCSHFDTYN